jgi:hypothetical protein
MFPRVFASAALVVFATGASAATKREAITDPAAAGPDFAVQGEYIGDEAAAQVIALGEGKFQIIGYTGGLPGAVTSLKSRSISRRA